MSDVRHQSGTAPLVRISDRDPAYEQVCSMCGHGVHIEGETWRTTTDGAMAEMAADPTPENADRLKNLRSYSGPIYAQAITGERVRCAWELQGPGRIGTVEPPLQQITKGHGIRTAIVPAAGHRFVVGDWRAAHVLIAAGLSRDPHMLAALSEGNLYEQAAATWKTTPGLAKICALSTLNGAGPALLAETLADGTTEGEAKGRRDQWLDTYPTMRATLRNWHGRREWRSPLGRKVSMPDEKGDYNAVGWTLQAIEADALRLVLLDIRWPVVLTVHDEVILEVLEADATQAAADLRASMDKALREVADLRDMVGDTVRVEVRRAWRES